MDGAETFEFLKKHNIESQNITFLGGVSGPGGFSSLRVGSGILNALAFAKKLPIHQVRADLWIAEFLKQNKENPDHFLLNSFSDGVFFIEKNADEVSQPRLQRININEAAEKFKDQKMFVDLLPAEKQVNFKSKIDLLFENAEKSLLEVLKKQSPQKDFVPDYEFPAV